MLTWRFAQQIYWLPDFRLPRRAWAQSICPTTNFSSIGVSSFSFADDYDVKFHIGDIPSVRWPAHVIVNSCSFFGLKNVRMSSVSSSQGQFGHVRLLLARRTHLVRWIGRVKSRLVSANFFLEGGFLYPILHIRLQMPHATNVTFTRLLPLTGTWIKCSDDETWQQWCLSSPRLIHHYFSCIISIEPLPLLVLLFWCYKFDNNYTGLIGIRTTIERLIHLVFLFCSWTRTNK